MAKAGNPTLFGEHMVEDTEEYLKPFIQFAEDLDNELAPTGIPTLAGLSIRLGVSKATVIDWKKLKVVEGDPVRTDENISQYAKLVALLEALQEVYTAHRGLNNTYNATIGKLVLAKHGYTDKVDHVSSDGSMSPPRNFNDMYETKDD